MLILRTPASSDVLSLVLTVVWIISVVLITVGIVLSTQYVTKSKYNSRVDELEAKIGTLRQEIRQLDMQTNRNTLRLEQLNGDVSALGNTTIRTSGASQTINGSLVITEDLTVLGDINDKVHETTDR